MFAMENRLRWLPEHHHGKLALVQDETPVIIEADTTTDLVRELQPLCDAGCACDLTLHDGTELAAVLVGVSSTALILDRWDSRHQGPAGDPFTVGLAALRRVVVP